MKHIVILGLGNSFWADTGFGMRAVEALHARYTFPKNVSLIDGAAEGEALLPLVEDADVLLIIDAVDFGLNPGTVKLLDDASVANRLRANESWLPQINLVDALDKAHKASLLPSKIRLIAVQPLEFETYGTELSEPARSQIETAVAEMVTFLAQIGIVAVPRQENFPPEPLHPAVIDLATFEAGNFA